MTRPHFLTTKLGVFLFLLISSSSVSLAISLFDQNVATPEDTPIEVVLQAFDAEGDPLEYNVTLNPTNGTLSVVDGNASRQLYTPNPDFNGTDLFSWRATDTNDTTSFTDANVTLTVTQVNDAPEILSDGGGDVATLSFTENSTALVLTALATDVEGDVPSYSISAGPDDGDFSINAVTGEVTFVTPPDYENGSDSDGDSIYHFVLTASDGSLTDDQNVTVTVTDVPDPPIITGGATASSTVVEGQTAVADVDATDQDGDSLTYTILGVEDGAKFLIDSATGVLTFSSAPDFETPTDVGDTAGNNTYVVDVNVTDGANWDVQTITVTVTDLNDEAPVITGGATASFPIAENQTGVTTVAATDDDAGASLTYAIAGVEDEAKFSIVPGTGVLTFLSAPDFETPTDVGDTAGNNTYVVDVNVTDGANWNVQTITVTVTDLNDEAPVITGGATASFTIAENQTAVTTVAATDDDAGASLTYTILGVEDGAKFSIVPGSGVLTFSSAPDFEIPTDVGDTAGNNTYVVDVNVSDGANWDVQTITVTVTNVNDAVPSISSDGAGSSATVPAPENQLAVTTVTATDDDNSSFIFSITGGADDGNFTIVPSTGVLTFFNPPDFENETDSDTNNDYIVEVTASDGINSDVQTITVTVTDASDVPPVITQSDPLPTVTMDEDGSPVAWSAPTLGAMDSEAGDTLTWTLKTPASNGTATVSGASASPSVPSITYVPNADYNGADSFVVQVSDGTFTVEITVPVQVDPQPDAPVITSLDGNVTSTVAVQENQTAVTTVTATDADVDSLTYSLAGTGTDEGNFTIDPSTGVLTFLNSPNFESASDTNTDNDYVVGVSVTDGDGATANATQTITVTVTDVNDPPVILDPFGAPAVSGLSATISEDGSPIAFSNLVSIPGFPPTATDTDTGDTANLTWSVSSDPTHGVATAAGTGASMSTFSYVPDGNYTGVDSFVVEVSDGVLTDTILVDVTVSPVADSPVITSLDGNATSSISIFENETAVVMVVANDGDGDAIIFSISGGVDAALFDLDVNTGVLTFNPAPDFENPTDSDLNRDYVVQVTASDGTTPVTQTITVTVTNVNEAPVIAQAPGPLTVTMTEDDNSSWVSPTLTASDSDGDVLTWTLSSAAANGDANVSGTGSSFPTTFDYAPTPNFSGIDSFDVQVSDGSLTATITVDVNMTNVNDPPYFTILDGNASGSFIIPENQAFVMTVTAEDPDGDTLFIGSGGGADQLKFDFNATTLDLAFLSEHVPSFEANGSIAGNNQYEMRLDLSDGLTPLQFVTIYVTITDVNDAPVITTLDGNATASISVDENFVGTVVDVDAIDEDFGPQQNLDYSLGGADAALFSWDAATGVLAFLSSPDYEEPGDADANRVYELTVTVTDDGNGTLTDVQTISVTVNNLNDNVPVITSGSGATATLGIGEDQYDVTDVNATDADGDSLTYSITGGADQASFKIDAATGDLDFDKTNPPPDFEQEGARAYVVEVTASDGTFDDAQTITVTLEDRNDPPVPNQFFSLDEDMPKSGSVALSGLGAGVEYRKYADPSQGALTWDVNGSWSYVPESNFNGQEQFTFRVYDASDPEPFSPVITVYLNVIAVNDDPVLAQSPGPLPVTMSEDGSPTAWVAPTLSATDDDSAAVLTWTVSSVPSNGSASFGDPSDSATLVYAPTGDWSGSDSFDVQVSDGVVALAITVDVTVDPVNEAPVITEGAGPLSVAMSEDASPLPWATPALNATDVDTADGDLTWSLLSAASHGTAIVSGTGLTPATFSYAPNADFNGTDSFVVRVSDSEFDDDVTIEVTVQNVNDAPVITEGAGPLPYTMSEDGSPTAWPVPTLNATDVDSADVLSWSVSTPASHGAAAPLSLSGYDSAFTYLPDADFNGTDSFVVKVSDGNGGEDVITVNVTVQNVNDPPVITQGAGPLEVTMTEDDNATWSAPTLTSTDVDFAPTSSWSVSTPASNGTASFSDSSDSSTLSYLPNVDFNGTDPFVVKVSDGNGGEDVITVTVTVANVNDAPVITEGNSITVTMSEDGSPTAWTAPALNVTDVDSADVLTWSVSSTASHGTAEVNGTGASPATVSYVPDADFNGTDSFVVKVTDGNLTTDVITVTVTVVNVNDDPVITEGNSTTVSMSEDGSPTAWVAPALNATDVDSADVLTWSVSSNASNGSASFSDSSDPSTLVYLPTANSYGSDSFVARVSDGNLTTDDITIDIAVTAVNDAPEITSWDGNDTVSVTINENNATVKTLTAIDVEGDALTWSKSDGADEALFDLTPSTGVLTFAVAPDFEDPADDDGNNTYVVEVTVTDDGNGTLTDVQTITVTVADVNELPSIGDGSSTASLSVNENNATVATLTVDDEDPDDYHTWSISGGADAHLFDLSAGAGELALLTAPDFENPTDSDMNNAYLVEVTVTDDGDGNLTSVQTITVSVNNLNDAPSLVHSGALTHSENLGPVIDLNATDDDGGERRPDVMFASGDNDFLGWFSNQGGGVFGAQNIIPGTVDGPHAMDVGDLNYDGDLDVVSVSRYDGKIAWYENKGDGLFDSDSAVTISEGVYDPRAVRLADLDGDEDLDLLVASYVDGQVIWFENNGLGSFGSPMTIDASADGAYSVWSADLDGDGDPDVLSASGKDDTVAWYENNGSAGGWTKSVISSSVDNARSVQAADLDGDGDLDVLAASYNDDTIYWFANDGNGTFSPMPSVTTTADGAYSVHAADLDGDGDLDVLSASFKDDTIAWYENDGAGGFGAGIVLANDALGARFVNAADLDGDGDLDVLSAAETSGVIAWYENDGAGGFGAGIVLANDAAGATFVMAADLDWTGDVLKYSIADGNDTFAIDVDSGVLTFLSPPDFEIPTDEDEINEYVVTVQVTDGNVSATQTINVTVADVNDAPVIVQGESIDLNMSEDGNPTAWSAPDLSATDAEWDALTWSVSDNASNGSASFSDSSDPSTLTYVPNAEFNGTDSFAVQVSDSELSDAIMVNVTVVNANDVPVITEGNSTTVTMSEDGSPDAWVAPTLTASDVDNAASQLTWSVETNATNGTATVEGNGTSPDTFTYVPDDDFNGADSFVVQVSDGELNATVTVNVTVNAVNDAPVLNDLVAVVNMSEDGSPTAWSVPDLNATDVDVGDTLTLTWSVLSGPSDGNASFADDGNASTLVYVPNADFNGTDGFVVQVSDGDLNDTMTVNVTVAYVNDAPVITEGNSTTVTMSEDGSPDAWVAPTLTASDVDNAASQLTWSVETNATNGTATVEGNGTSPDTFTYVPDADFNGVDSFVVQVSDGELNATVTVNVTVNAENDEPVVVDINATLDEDGNASIALQGTDVEGSSLTYHVVSGPGHGTVTVVDGNATYVPEANYWGPDSFTYLADDGDLNGSAMTVDLNVTSVNDAPEVTNWDSKAKPSISVNENNATVQTLTAFDVEGDALTWSVSSGADKDLFDLNASTGVLSFSSAPDYENPFVTDGNNTYVVEVKVTDDGNVTLTDVRTITVTVVDVNEPPSIGDGSSTASLPVNENNATVATLTVDDEDPDDNHTWSKSGGTDKDLFDLNASTGVLSFVTAPDYENPTDSDGNNTYVVEVTVTDGNLSDVQAITVVVSDRNEAPEVTNWDGNATASITVNENETSVADLNATDFDPADALTWSKSGGADEGNFTIDASTGVLSFVTAPDFEANGSADGNNTYVVEVTVADNADGNLTDVQTITVIVLDVNEAPEVTNWDSNATASIVVNENETSVAALNATDFDPADTLTWSKSGGADKDLFDLNASTGVLTFSPAPDYENPTDADANNTYVVEVTVTDDGNGTLTDIRTITVTVVEVNDAPVFVGFDANASFTVAENDTFSIDLDATDQDEDVLSYSLGGTDADDFDLNVTTGLLSLIEPPDYENPEDSDGDNVYLVEVNATDGNASTVLAISLTVTDLNDPPAFESYDGNESKLLTVPENSPFAVELNATDVNDDALTFSLEGIDADDFDVNSSSGVLSLIAIPDYEMPTDADGDNVYEVDVIATDDGNGTLSAVQTIMVEVTDVPDPPDLVSGLTLNRHGKLELLHPENERQVIDLNATDTDGGEHRPDVLFASDNNLIGWFSNKGNGSFGSSLNSISIEPGQHYSLAAGDLDHDGDLDVVSVARGSDNIFKVHINLDQGEFNTPAPMESGVEDPVSVHLVDINADAKLDLLIGSYADGKVVWLEGYGNGSFGNPNTIGETLGVSSTWFADFDGDGDQDVLAALAREDAVVWYENNGTASDWKMTVISDEVDNPKSVHAGDMDGDGDVDVLSASYNDDTIAWFANEGDGTFGPLQIITDRADGAYSVHAADLDNDGLLDVLSASSKDNEVAWYRNLGTGAFTGAQFISTISEGVRFVNTADLDNDGDLDVLSASSDSGEIAWHENLGLEIGRFSYNDPQVLTTDALGANFVMAADLDWGGNQLKYQIVEGGDTFKIDADSGVLSFIDPPDYENPTDRDGINEYSVTVAVLDGDRDSTLTIDLEIVPVNDAPVFESSERNETVSENSDFAIDLNATDQDFKDNLTYSLGGIDRDDFELDSSSGVLTLIESPDFESPTDADQNNTYVVEVNASDGSLWDVQTIRLVVTDVNEPPVITSGDGNETELDVEENQVFVTMVEAEDQDFNETLTYEVSGGADKDLFDINASTGELFFLPPPPDYEHNVSASGNHEYVVEVNASDGSLWNVQTITVTVADVNDAPVITSWSAGSEIVEAKENQTFVVRVEAADDDDLDSMTFSVSGGADKDFFDINATSGELTFKTAPNYESPIDADANNTYVVEVNATDGYLWDIRTITVMVEGGNDAPVLVGGDAVEMEVDENEPYVTLILAQDEDGDELFYSLIDPADQQIFEIYNQSGFGNLYFIDEPNFEDGNNTYLVEVRARDTGNPAGFDDQNITITVVDVNDAPEITSPGVGDSASVDAQENQVSVTTVQARDDDADDLTFRLSGGADQDLFALDASSGALSFNAAPDFESPSDTVANGTNTYEVEVTVTDNGDGNLTDVQTITVNVTNVNEPPVITSNFGTSTATVVIVENTTVVTTVTANDPDADDLTFSLSGGADQALFALNASLGALSFKTAPDFETGITQYVVEVTVTDNGDSNLTAVQTITVNVTGVNDNPPVILTAVPGSITVIENRTAAVIDVDASDGDGDTITYSISGADKASFHIDSSTGVLTFKTAPDFENPSDTAAKGTNTYEVEVIASDAGVETPDDILTISVNVTNENEPPSITSPTVAIFEIDENTTDVTTFVADDPDGEVPVFNLSGGTDEARFTIDGSSGALKFVFPPDFEFPGDFGKNNSYEVEVTAGDGLLTDVRMITVNVKNLNDNPPEITSNGGASAAVVEVFENNTTVTTVVSADPDSTASRIYSLSGGEDMGLFAIHPQSGALTFKTPKDFENPSDADGNNTYVVVVKVSDTMFEDLQTITARVINVYEAPVIVSPQVSLAVVMTEDNASSWSAPDLNATDVDAVDTLTWTVSSGPSHGNASFADALSASSLVYSPNPDFNGTDSFEVKVTDLGGLTDTIQVTVTVNNVNDGPVPSNLNVSVNEDETTAIILSASDLENDGVVAYYLESGPSHGTLVVTGGVATYVPSANYVGLDSFTYLASDGDLNGTVATVTLTVSAVNDPPNAVDDAFNVADNGATYVLDVLRNDNSFPDLDSDETLFISGFASASKGSVTQVGGRFRYTPKTGYVGADSFTYDVSDGRSTSTATVVVTITSSTSDSLRGWNQLPAFGAYYDLNRPWLYHQTLGWIYVAEDNGEQVAAWMWSEELGWFWTGDAVFPYLWLRDLNSWVYLDQDVVGDKWRVFDFSQSKWISSGDVLRERLVAALEGSPNAADSIQRIQGLSGLSPDLKNAIVAELTYFGKSTLLDELGVVLSY